MAAVVRGSWARVLSRSATHSRQGVCRRTVSSTAIKTYSSCTDQPSRVNTRRSVRRVPTGSRACPNFLQRGIHRSLATKAGKKRGIETTAEEAGHLRYPGAPTAEHTTIFALEKKTDVWPVYRVLDTNGHTIRPDYELLMSQEQAVQLYKEMRTLLTMDNIFYDAQRQGRISFYMTSYGEEAAVICSAAGLQPQDMVFAQYREPGVLMHRGFTLQEFADQCFSNKDDRGKGRQMPVHYGSKNLNYQTVSSPLTTQLPQAAGAAYAFKREGSDRVAVCYFGDGAASEGDFHAAMNFAATLKCPVMFICRNNGFAISTPTEDQYAGDGIISRMIGYGIRAIRVDGNDALAVHEATLKARKHVKENNEPVFLELMTYRAGHHSTSDDSSRYRPNAEIQAWQTLDNPIQRTRLFLENKGWWDAHKEAELLPAVRKAVLTAFDAAESKKSPPISELFTDVYHDIPDHLQKQRAEMEQHLEEFASVYAKDIADHHVE